jgi:hypothetical protein
MNKIGCTLLSLLVVALVLGVGTAAAQDDFDFQEGYFANANAPGAPSAQLRLTNDGAYSAANLCANIYVFDSAEEMQECCSCEITANGYLDLSINSNLLGNILNHGTVPTRGFIQETTSIVPPGGCNPVAYIPFEGIRGWLTHVQKGATAGTFSLTETPLAETKYESGEEVSVDLQQTCSFVQSLGTGTGVCSCADAGD